MQQFLGGHCLSHVGGCEPGAFWSSTGHARVENPRSLACSIKKSAARTYPSMPNRIFIWREPIRVDSSHLTIRRFSLTKCNEVVIRILAVKYEIDRTQTKGRFALAGSTRFLTDPRITESLTGRVRFVDLWPLSQGEIDRTTDSFIDRAFQNSTGFLDERPTALSRLEIFERVVRGGFPESVLSESPVDRSEFFADYVRTITTRDVRELADLEHTARFRQIVRLVAARTATELNYSDIARTLDMSVATMRRYLPLFETVYLHHTLPSWSRNLSTKVVHRSKIHMVDSGIASHLLGFDAKGMNRSPAAAVGQLFESFVAAELAKQLTWSDTQASLYHWRARTGQEVDLLLESLQGQVVGIEVKTTVDLDESDFNGLKTLRDRIGADFVGGILIHCGDRPRTFGDRLFSVPASALWE